MKIKTSAHVEVFIFTFGLLRSRNFHVLEAFNLDGFFTDKFLLSVYICKKIGKNHPLTVKTHIKLVSANNEIISDGNNRINPT